MMEDLLIVDDGHILLFGPTVDQFEGCDDDLCFPVVELKLLSYVKRCHFVGAAVKAGRLALVTEKCLGFAVDPEPHLESLLVLFAGARKHMCFGLEIGRMHCVVVREEGRVGVLRGVSNGAGATESDQSADVNCKLDGLSKVWVSPIKIN